MEQQLQHSKHSNNDYIKNMILHVPHIRSLKILDEKDIDILIIEERNEEMRKISEEMQHLSDISLSLKELVVEQKEELEIAADNVETAEEDIEEATKNLTVTEKLANKFKNIFAKGALISTGVTGVGAATGILLNPIAGGIGVVAGVGGIVYCIIQMAI